MGIGIGMRIGVEMIKFCITRLLYIQVIELITFYHGNIGYDVKEGSEVSFGFLVDGGC